MQIRNYMNIFINITKYGVVTWDSHPDITDMMSDMKVGSGNNCLCVYQILLMKVGVKVEYFNRYVAVLTWSPLKKDPNLRLDI